MILFAEDYAKFPTAVIDVNTQNKSFVYLAAKYKKMGIKNYAFILTTLNPALVGVDPHSKDLTLEQKLAIKIECKYNPWYFLREVARVKGQGGVDAVPFLANRGNVALFWCFLNHLDICLIQPRQTGKSVGADFIAEWVLMFSGYNTAINLVTLTEKLRVQNIERVKAAMKLLPPYLIDMRADDSDNSQLITYKALKNRFNSFVNQKAEDAARNTARGFTSPVNLMDEWAYFNWVKATMAGALGSSLAARENAERYNSPYGNVFTTTAGKRDSRDGAVVYEMISNGMQWNEAIFDCQNNAEARKMLKDHSTGSKQIINATFSHRQLGKTDEWLMNTMSELGLSGDEADRDLLNVWTNGSAASPLSIELNRIIAESRREPSWTERSPEGYLFKWYVPEGEIVQYMLNNQCVLGVDTSDIIGRDATTFVLRDVRTLAVVGVMGVRNGNLNQLTKWFANFLLTYPSVTCIIESKSSAYSFIDRALVMLPLAGINPFARLYNSIVQERDKRETDYSEVMNPRNIGNSLMYEKFKRSFGFNTAAASRDTLYREILQTSARTAGHRVYDEKLANEITGLVLKNNRIDHKASGHDDHVISWLISHWLLSHGRNLDAYGIDALQAMSMVTDARKGEDEKERIMVIQRRALRKRIEETVSALKRSNSGSETARLEHQLRMLSEQTHYDGGEAMSIDGLMREAEEARKAQVTRDRFRQQTNAANFGDVGGVPWYYAA